MQNGGLIRCNVHWSHTYIHACYVHVIFIIFGCCFELKRINGGESAVISAMPGIVLFMLFCSFVVVFFIPQLCHRVAKWTTKSKTHPPIFKVPTTQSPCGTHKPIKHAIFCAILTSDQTCWSPQIMNVLPYTNTIGIMGALSLIWSIIWILKCLTTWGGVQK